jgi:hypothetical protein
MNRMSDPMDADEASLFGSLPSSPSPSSPPTLPILALPGPDGVEPSTIDDSRNANVGPIALPGPHAFAELAPRSPVVASPAPGLPGSLQPIFDPALRAPAASSSSGVPISPRTRTHGRTQPLASGSRPRASAAASAATVSGVSNGPAAPTRRPRASTRIGQGNRSSTAPAPPSIPLPSTTSPPPANFLRNSTALLGHAGLVGNVHPARLPQPHLSGRTREDPIVLDRDDGSSTATVQTTKAPAPPPGAVPSQGQVLQALVKDREAVATLSEILRLAASTKQHTASTSTPTSTSGTGVATSQDAYGRAVKRRRFGPAPSASTISSSPTASIPIDPQNPVVARQRTRDQARLQRLVARLVVLIQEAARQATRDLEMVRTGHYRVGVGRYGSGSNTASVMQTKHRKGKGNGKGPARAQRGRGEEEVQNDEDEQDVPGLGQDESTQRLVSVSGVEHCSDGHEDYNLNFGLEEKGEQDDTEAAPLSFDMISSSAFDDFMASLTADGSGSHIGSDLNSTSAPDFGAGPGTGPGSSSGFGSSSGMGFGLDSFGLKGPISTSASTKHSSGSGHEVGASTFMDLDSDFFGDMTLPTDTNMDVDSHVYLNAGSQSTVQDVRTGGSGGGGGGELDLAGLDQLLSMIQSLPMPMPAVEDTNTANTANTATGLNTNGGHIDFSANAGAYNLTSDGGFASSPSSPITDMHTPMHTFTSGVIPTGPPPPVIDPVLLAMDAMTASARANAANAIKTSNNAGYSRQPSLSFVGVGIGESGPLSSTSTTSTMPSTPGMVDCDSPLTSAASLPEPSTPTTPAAGPPEWHVAFPLGTGNQDQDRDQGHRKVPQQAHTQTQDQDLRKFALWNMMNTHAYSHPPVLPAQDLGFGFDLGMDMNMDIDTTITTSGALAMDFGLDVNPDMGMDTGLDGGLDLGIPWQPASTSALAPASVLSVNHTDLSTSAAMQRAQFHSPQLLPLAPAPVPSSYSLAYQLPLPVPMLMQPPGSSLSFNVPSSTLAPNPTSIPTPIHGSIGQGTSPLGRPPGRPPGKSGAGKPPHKTRGAIVASGLARKKLLEAELERARIELWEATIEGAALAHLGKALQGK